MWVLLLPAAQFVPAPTVNPQMGAALDLPIFLLLVFVLGLLRGAAVGIAQWLAQRWGGYRFKWWIPATAVAWSFGLVVALAVGSITAATPSLVSALIFVMPGVLAGCVQWVLLRGTVARAELWVLATMIGWVLGAGIAATSGWTISAVGIVVAWGFSGLAMHWLLRHPLSADA